MEHRYSREGITYEYISDYDILLITGSGDERKDYEVQDDIGSFQYQMQQFQLGLAVSYQNNFSPRLVFNCILSSAFIEQTQKNEGKKELFLEAAFSTRAN